MPYELQTSEGTLPYTVVSVARFPEFREQISEIKKRDRFSQHPLFQGYVKDLNFQLPPDFDTARSVILVASRKKIAQVLFHYRGKKRLVTIPPQYYANGIGWKTCMDLVKDTLLPDPASRIQLGNDYLFLKYLAVRTGLGEYGRNNICYVRGMGSFSALYAYFTDAVLEESPLGALKLMETCRHCLLCAETCPNGCISEDDVLIDVNRCITLYNEADGDFPEWINPEAHNALMGCLLCQRLCPENLEVMKEVRVLEEISEEETEAILAESAEGELMERISQKLSRFAAANAESRKIFSRNLRVLLETGSDSVVKSL
ncbi:MAG TPA: 4Fe-4S double cluster binding domain-containing protein [Thermotogota bacterium]|nr:4Fe-4S double cluster binding domain-containing protein [Thermotogota bacterium]